MRFGLRRRVGFLKRVIKVIPWENCSGGPGFIGILYHMEK
jgi:hypothetical protein